MQQSRNPLLLSEGGKEGCGNTYYKRRVSEMTPQDITASHLPLRQMYTPGVLRRAGRQPCEP